MNPKVEAGKTPFTVKVCQISQEGRMKNEACGTVCLSPHTHTAGIFFTPAVAPGTEKALLLFAAFWPLFGWVPPSPHTLVSQLGWGGNRSPVELM